MKSFDIDEYNSRECEVHNHGFYLGEQSKQAEVDELQKRIDKALSFVEDAHSENWQDCISCINNILKGDQS